jgi:hypothetical protein
MFQGNASEEELQTVVETIESKLKDFQHTPNASIGTFQAEDVLKSCFSHDDDYLIHEIQLRATVSAKSTTAKPTTIPITVPK